MSKQYKLGGMRIQRTENFRELLQRTASSPFRALAGRTSDDVAKEELYTFWALHNVSFDVKQGDVLGIIGRNGAGKSTMLKILSRITSPTSGSVDHSRETGQPARSWDRVSSRAYRPREYFFERGDPGDAQGGNHPAL